MGYLEDPSGVNYGIIKGILNNFMESIEQLPDFEELLAVYGKEKADFPDDSELKDLKFSHPRDEIQNSMNDAAASQYDAFMVGEEDGPATVLAQETDYSCKKVLKLGEVVIDDSIPLVMTISKFFFKHKEENYKDECIDFSLERRGVSPPEEIGMIRMKDCDGGFDVAHRDVLPEYRGKGLGTLLLNAGESFMETVVDKREKEQKLIAKVGQLDVLFWLWKRGYRPDSKKDEDMLLRVLNAEGLMLYDRYFVFEDTVKDEDLYFEGFEKTPEYINYHEAISITMSKKIEMGDSAEIADIQSLTSGQVSAPKADL